MQMTTSRSQQPRKPRRERSRKTKLKRISAHLDAYTVANPRASQLEIANEAARATYRICGGDEHGADLFASLHAESDRGFVLVVAAIVDERLEVLLRKFFASRSAVVSARDVGFWFKDGAIPPLQSTAMKIRLSLVLGLIDQPLKAALTKLQSLRSTIAAHTREPFSLKDAHSVEIANCLEKDVQSTVTSMLRLDEVVWLSKAYGVPKIVFALVVQKLLVLIEKSHKRIRKGIPAPN
jgi:hypothetical protein